MYLITCRQLVRYRPPSIHDEFQVQLGSKLVLIVCDQSDGLNTSKNSEGKTLTDAGDLGQPYTLLLELFRKAWDIALALDQRPVMGDNIVLKPKTISATLDSFVGWIVRGIFLLTTRVSIRCPRVAALYIEYFATRGHRLLTRVVSKINKYSSYNIGCTILNSAPVSHLF